jgi:competence protein ComEC
MEQAGIDVQRVKSSRLAEYAACDRLGCVSVIDDRTIAISGKRSGLKDDCDRADVVIALYPVAKRDRKGCKATLIDRRDAWNSGAHAVYVAKDGVKITSAAETRGARPWTE